MKALLLEEYGRLEYKDVPEPIPMPRDVLIDVKACGICGSDVHGMDGSTGRRVPPIIMGHEAAGVIAQIGDEVKGWQLGDRVTFDSTIFCNQCSSCRKGRVNLCSERRVLGVSCQEYRQHGALAEQVAVPSQILHRLPDNVTFEQAALVEPLSVSCHAAGILPIQGGESCLIVGAGVIGLFALQVLKNRGCDPVYIVDINPKRVQVAMRLGALVAPKSIEVDLALEAVGLPETFAEVLGSLKKGGHLAMVGNLASSVKLPLQLAVTRELTLHGSCASAGEYPHCLDLIATGAVQTDPILSAVAPLAEGALWFERLRKKKEPLLKVVLIP